MSSLTYAEKLRDPRWQQMRLKVMERDGFTCQHCESADRTLNVHHHAYRKGAMPWDYDPEDMITLCEDCHQAHSMAIETVTRQLSKNPELLTAIIRLAGFGDEEGPFAARCYENFRITLQNFIRAISHFPYSLDEERQLNESGFAVQFQLAYLVRKTLETSKIKG